jgi:hypothetical protein
MTPTAYQSEAVLAACAGGDLRRQIGDGPHHPGVAAGDRLLVDVGGQTKVQDHRPTRAGDQDVGGLEIPVQLAGLVERLEPGGHLAERVAEAGFVEGQMDRRRRRRFGFGVVGPPQLDPAQGRIDHRHRR